MSKKRNLAVLMAAATVATSVAPVFADTTASLDGQEFSVKDSEKLAQFKKEIEGYFNTKYTTDKDLLDDEDNAGQSVFTISVSVDGTNFTTVPNMKELDKFIVNMNDKNDKISVKVADLKGYKEVDGKILDNEVKTYKSSHITELKEANEADSTLADLEGLDPDPDKAVDFGKDTIVLSLQNNDEKLVLKQGAEKTVHMVGTKVVGVPVYKEDAYGNKLDKDGKKTEVLADYVCLGFEKFKEPITDLDDERKYDLTNEDVVESVKANELYNVDLGKLTLKGNEIANFIKEYNSKADNDITKGSESTTTKLVIRVPGIITGVENKFSTLTITGTEKEIADLDNIFFGNGTALKISTIAGEDREATSIEVSKATFADKDDTKVGVKKATDVVLVSGYAIADGLAATPFAAAKNAPVLLTGKDKISDKVMDEIQRVKDANGKVYLVGGTNSLSSAIEDQLDAKYIKFERIAGADRADTSLKIAKKMVDDKDTTLKDLFVAGGYAEADAMSIAAIASSDLGTGKLNTNSDNKVDPILLADKDGLTKDQLTWLGRQDTISTTYIAGGVNSVPASVTSSLNGISEKTYRLAGEDRQATNAEVLTEFYKDVTDLVDNTVYVAKSDNNGLVDALPAGVLAAQSKSPVILATDALSADQEAALKAFKSTTKIGNIAKKTQIGNSIADKVWKAINDIK